MLFYPCNICLLTEFQHNFRLNVVLFKDLYSSFPLFDRVFFKKITPHTFVIFHFRLFDHEFCSLWFHLYEIYIFLIHNQT